MGGDDCLQMILVVSWDVFMLSIRLKEDKIQKLGGKVVSDFVHVYDEFASDEEFLSVIAAVEKKED